jgi:hypothetical protein
MSTERDLLETLQKVERHLRRLTERLCGPEPKRASAASVSSVRRDPLTRAVLNVSDGSLPRDPDVMAQERDQRGGKPSTRQPVEGRSGHAR